MEKAGLRIFQRKLLAKLLPEEWLNGCKRRAATSQWCRHPPLLQNLLLNNFFLQKVLLQNFLLQNSLLQNCLLQNFLLENSLSLASSFTTFTFCGLPLHIFFFLIILFWLLLLNSSFTPCLSWSQPPARIEVNFLIPKNLKIIIYVGRFGVGGGRGRDGGEMLMTIW